MFCLLTLPELSELSRIKALVRSYLALGRQAYSCVLLIRQLPRVRSYSCDAFPRCTVVVAGRGRGREAGERGEGLKKRTLGCRHAFLGILWWVRRCCSVAVPQKPTIGREEARFCFSFFFC